jgi:hypothetical protein
MNATPLELILELHSAWCSSRGLDVPINAAFERHWFEAHKAGIEPDDIKLVVKHRLKLNQATQSGWSLNVHRLVGSDDDLAMFFTHLAEARAAMRKPVYDAGKVVVLGATGRETEPKQPPARSVKDVIAGLREAAK